MTWEEELYKAFHAYMEAYFRERSEEKTLAMFHPSITCFGTGADEKAFEARATRDLYRRDFEQAPNPIDVEYLFTEAVPLTGDTGLVFTEINISGTIMKQPFVMNGLRLTTVFIKIDRQWRLVHKHISIPTDIHESGEAYPLKEITERNRLLEKMVEEKTRELKNKNTALEQALLQIRTLRGLLPICANCKKIRDDTGYWRQVEDYISNHSEAKFSHSICPDCIKVLYPDLAPEILDKNENE